MKPYLASCALAVFYAVAGFGVLSLAGIRPAPALRTGTIDVVKLLGLAYMAGLAGSSIVQVALMCVGGPVTLASLAIICLLLAAAGGAVAWRAVVPADRRAGPSASRAELWIAGAMLVGTLVYLALGMRWSSVLAPYGWDGWTMWLHKGDLLYVFGRMPTVFFTSPAYFYMNQSYPMLVPLMNAMWFHLGGFDTVGIHTQYWTLFVATLWAVGYIASRRARLGVWVPLVALFMVLPNVRSQLVTLYADVPMALLLLIGVLWLVEWLSEDSGMGALWLAVLFLAAAASTKSEGQTAAVAAILSAWIVVLATDRVRKRLRSLAAGTVGLAVLVAPWQIWVSAHHIAESIPITKGLDPSWIIGRIHRLSPSASSYFHSVVSPGWYLVAPAALLLAVIGLWFASMRRAALFFLVCAVLNVVTMLWVYVISFNPVPTLSLYLEESTYRTVDGLVFVAFAALLTLTGQIVQLERSVVRRKGQPEASGIRLVQVPSA